MDVFFALQIALYKNVVRALLPLSPLTVSRREYQKTGVLSRCKSTLITMKPDLPNFERLFTPELNTLISLFEKHKYEIRIAGGAVRDLLLGKIPQDVDFATTATPDQMKALFEQEKIRMINAKGEKHGTITCRINDKVNQIVHLMIKVYVCV